MFCSSFFLLVNPSYLQDQTTRMDYISLITQQPEDGAIEAGLSEDEEYDALNDETFGSAAVDGDWEECHEQMVTLTEAGRITSKQQDFADTLRQEVRDASFIQTIFQCTCLNTILACSCYIEKCLHVMYCNYYVY